MTGFVEILEANRVAGWACDDENFGHSATVEIYQGEVLVAAGCADLFRSDLVRAGVGSGYHGFDIPAPNGRLFSLNSIRIVAKHRDEAAEELKLLPEPTNLSTTGIIECHQYPHPSMDLEQKPVFVLGSARSGTSAVAQALLQSTRYKGFEEGHLLTILQRLKRVVDLHYERNAEEWAGTRPTLISAVPQSFLHAALHSLLVTLAKTIFPGPTWLDKTPTPEMIIAAPLLRDVWPSAKFIFMKRRGLENVQSRLKKFPSLSFDFHCKDWAESLQVWSAARLSLQGSCVEIDQRFLARQPWRVATALQDLLSLSDEETHSLSHSLQTSHPELSSPSCDTLFSVAESGWGRQRLESFKTLCGPMMEKFGYSYDDRYFLPEGNTCDLVYW